MDIMADGTTLRLSGDLTGRSTAAIRGEVHRHLDRYGDRAVLDVADVTAVDATALRMLAAASCRAGRQVRLRGASAPIRRLLHLTRLHRFVRAESTPVGA
ncbi:STAS domain-containing protein [Nocardioides panacisoli]|uniref:STAS domain-containing protein n=1 Tax=Nocardioides panacisoli TaxID=627624 RepID=UPI001C637B59|nr:STAS domain-containing protein [Nocardioides panacisoli]QYJ05605.1 STAS domain-containing protein [Nocardioides panacisoli]